MTTKVSPATAECSQWGELLSAGNLCLTAMPLTGWSADDLFVLPRVWLTVLLGSYLWVLVLCVGPLNITAPNWGQLLAGIPAYFLGLKAPSPFTCSWDTSGPSTSSRLTWWQIFTSYCVLWASLVAQMVKNLPAVQETWVRYLGWEDPLEEGMATHSSLLAWRSPIDKGAWQATAHGVTKSQTRLNDWAHALCSLTLFQLWMDVLWLLSPPLSVLPHLFQFVLSILREWEGLCSDVAFVSLRATTLESAQINSLLWPLLVLNFCLWYSWNYIFCRN